MRLIFLELIYLLLVFSFFTKTVTGKIPDSVEDKQLCAMKTFSDVKRGRRVFALYDKVNDIHHHLRCESGLSYPNDKNLSTRCIGEDCPHFLKQIHDKAGFVFAKTKEEEYGLDMGVLPGVEHKIHHFFIFWVGSLTDKNEKSCDFTWKKWNIFFVKDYNEKKIMCNSEQDEKYFTWSRNHDRGFPLAVIMNSNLRITNLDFIWQGCTSPLNRENNTCIRLMNSRINGHADHIHPPDVRKAIDSIRNNLKSKQGGGEAGVGRAEHPRQMFNYIMLGGSLLFLIAVIASIFAIPKDHDFPIMYQKGIATVAKKTKKGKKAGKTTGKTSTGLGGKTSTGLTGIGKSTKGTSGMGKTTGSTMNGSVKKKDKKAKGPKKDKKKGKK